MSGVVRYFAWYGDTPSKTCGDRRLGRVQMSRGKRRQDLTNSKSTQMQDQETLVTVILFDF